MKSQVGFFLLTTFMLIGNFEVKASSAPPSQELILPHSKINSPNIQKNPSLVERIMLKKIENKIQRKKKKTAKGESKGKDHRYGILSILMLVAGLLCIQIGMTFSQPILLGIAAGFLVPFIILGVISFAKKEKPQFVGLFSIFLMGAAVAAVRIGTTISSLYQILGF